MNKKEKILRDYKNAYIYVIYELLKGRKLTTKEIAEMTERTVRTAQRLIKDLKESDLPILKEKKKYYLNTDDGYLPIYFTRDKINMLYISLISFNNFGKNKEIINELINQIEELVSTYDKEMLECLKQNMIIKKRYEIISEDISAPYKIFILLVEALCKKRRVTIKFISEYRTIDVYGFCLAKEAYYINGYCHKSKDIRQFRLDRILGCSLESETYIIPEKYNLKGYYKNTWEVENSKELYSFKIEFSKDAIKSVRERKWCENQEVLYTNQNTIIFSGSTTSEIELIKWILSYGGNAKVIEPHWLKEKIIKEHTKAIEQYGLYE
jgi:predicted DNA-binding transcriptional regulator YafY